MINIKTIEKRKVQFNRNFKVVNESKCRYVVCKGSAGSGKSTNVAQSMIIKLSDMKYKGANLLVVRKFDTSNRDSTFAELCKAVYSIYGANYDRYWNITTNPLSLKCKVTGNSIIFRGMKDDKEREKVKSISFTFGKLTWIWIEEATELQESDIEILDDRLRGILDNPNLFYQIIFTFNPVSAMHWLKRRYFDVKDDDVLAHSSTYLQNRFIDDNYHKRMLKRKEQDPDGYAVYGLGEWGESGGLILSNYIEDEISTDHNSYDYIRYSQDFGFNHANCILELGFKDNNLYVLDELYVYEKDTTEIIEMVNMRKPYWDKSIRMWCDSAEPDRIKMWNKAGWNKAKGIEKGPGSVKAQIDYLKGMKIYIHPRCQNVMKEIQQWKWIKDKKTGLYTDEPVPVFDDAMACLRYGIEDTRKVNQWFV